jgi:LuxR family maltose regulon positive regulatory protein
MGETKFPLMVTTGLATMKVWAWVRCGRLREAEQYFQERGLGPESAIVLPYQGEYRALALLLLARGKPVAAERLLERMLAWAETAGQPYWALCARVSLARAYQARRKQPQALEALAQALKIAAPEGYLQVFVDEGEALAPLITELSRQGVEPAFARRLLAALLPGPKLPEPHRHAERPAQSAHLTSREVEVLRLLADGLTNKEIAQNLSITLRTVKYHTTSLFTKLDVSNRTQAVTRAREKGII